MKFCDFLRLQNPKTPLNVPFLRAFVVQNRPNCACNLRKTDVTFKCMSCSDNLLAIYCNDCFQASNHRNLYYCIRMIGQCDCGNVNVFNRESFCEKHRLIEQRANMFESVGREERRKIMEQTAVIVKLIHL